MNHHFIRTKGWGFEPGWKFVSHDTEFNMLPAEQPRPAVIAPRRASEVLHELSQRKKSRNDSQIKLSSTPNLHDPKLPVIRNVEIKLVGSMRGKIFRTENNRLPTSSRNNTVTGVPHRPIGNGFVGNGSVGNGSIANGSIRRSGHPENECVLHAKPKPRKQLPEEWRAPVREYSKLVNGGDYSKVANGVEHSKMGNGVESRAPLSNVSNNHHRSEAPPLPNKVNHRHPDIPMFSTKTPLMKQPIRSSFSFPMERSRSEPPPSLIQEYIPPGVLKKPGSLSRGHKSLKKVAFLDNTEFSRGLP